MTAASVGELRRRVERLPPDRRAALAALLRAEDGAGDAAARLIAWVVPAHDGGIDDAELAAFLRDRLPAHMVPSAIVALAALPRLPNGKVDANALPAPARAAPPDAGTVVEPRDGRERTLAHIWSEVLGVERIGVHDNFFELGGDSILSIQVVARARRAGLRLAPDQVFEHQTLGRLAAAATAVEAEAPAVDVRAAPLAPIQAWFFAQRLSAPHHWHQAVWLEPRPGFDAARFETALHTVMARHDALRLTFPDDAGARARGLASGDARPAIADVVVPACDDAAFDAALDGIVGATCGATSLERGPLLRAVTVRRAGRAVELVLLCIHHLAVDAVSWGILLEDLAAAWATTDDSAPRRSTSYLAWAAALADAAAAGRFDDDIAHWSALPAPAPLPRELDGPFTEAYADTVAVALDETDTRSLIHDAHAAYNTQVEDVLVTALARALAAWQRTGAVRLGIERHGREDLVAGLDLTRSVGWFTSYFPVDLAVDPVHDAGMDLRDVKERLRAVPRRGASFGVLRYVRTGAAADTVRAVPEPEIVYNYAGRTDAGDAEGAPWRVRGLPFAARAAANERRHRMEVDAYLRGGSLHVRWSYATTQYRRQTVEGLAARFLAEVRAIVAHARATGGSGFTPSDFPDADLRQDELDRLLRELEG